VLSLRNNNPLDAIYIDFARAFDSIVHEKLLYKLTTFGLKDDLLAWLGAFLHDRTQCVVLENCQSKWEHAVSGVPQGSVLGPILFLLFINDIEKTFDNYTRIKLFADDVKLYSEIDFTGHSISLQQSLYNIEIWSADWQLPINMSKSSVLRLGFQDQRSNSYYINDFELAVVDITRDLGIEVDNCLFFRSHISNIVGQANARVDILSRGFQTRNLVFLKKAFVTYIRPILEYNCNIWNPYLKKSIDLI
jgi:ribonuclease P/MRP protein subunit RPP40